MLFPFRTPLRHRRHASSLIFLPSESIIGHIHLQCLRIRTFAVCVERERGREGESISHISYSRVTDAKQPKWIESNGDADYRRHRGDALAFDVINTRNETSNDETDANKILKFTANLVAVMPVGMWHRPFHILSVHAAHSARGVSAFLLWSGAIKRIENGWMETWGWFRFMKIAHATHTLTRANFCCLLIGCSSAMWCYRLVFVLCVGRGEHGVNRIAMQLNE